MTTEALVRSDVESDAVSAPPPATGSTGYRHGALDPFALTSVAETLELVVGHRAADLRRRGGRRPAGR